MFLAVDIGNSNIVIAIHDGESWIHKHREESKNEQPDFFYESGLRDILLEWGITPDDISDAAISSVVPMLTEKIYNAVAANTRLEPLVLSPELFLNLEMTIPKVYEIGSDLVANAYAANLMFGKNSIIIDFGTALTFTIYEQGAGITGVTIAPGLKTVISTLSDSTALLPEIEIDMPKSAIGKSTSTAISAGVLFGFVGMVKEILSRIQSELDDSYQVVVTGGLSTKIKELVPIYDLVDKNLTLDGIRLLALENKS